MVHKSKILPGMSESCHSTYTVHVFVPEETVNDICAFVVFEDFIKNSYRTDVALLALNTDGLFGSGKCPDDIFSYIETELGYIPGDFLYEAEYRDVLSKIYDSSDSLNECLDFINSVTRELCYVSLPVDDIVKEIIGYVESDSFIDNIFYDLWTGEV